MYVCNSISVYFLFCSTELAREKIFYSYTQNINGFAAILDDKEAADIASNIYMYICMCVCIHY